LRDLESLGLIKLKLKQKKNKLWSTDSSNTEEVFIYRLLATKVILGKKASLALPGVENVWMTFDKGALVNSRTALLRYII
jgi:hypothetical protein